MYKLLVILFIIHLYAQFNVFMKERSSVVDHKNRKFNLAHNYFHGIFNSKIQVCNHHMQFAARLAFMNI